jgi:hypothetical protein
MATPDHENYKLQKESFVSNLNGGSIVEINYVTAIAPVSGTFRVVFKNIKTHYLKGVRK